MAEALLRHIGGPRFEALSAGSHPSGYIHPLAAAAMRRMGVPMDGQRSKSWDEFAQKPLDVVITVCDQAAGETCPLWTGRAIRAFWPLPDPSLREGTEEERLSLTLEVAARVRSRLERLIALDFERLSESQIKSQLDGLAEL